MSSAPSTPPAATPPWVIVDDTDPEINYVGNSWFSDAGSQPVQGPYGPPYRSTLHGTRSSASLSYSFNGTAVMVGGTMLLRQDANVFDPTWECFLDGKSIGSNPTIGLWPETNKNLCGPVDQLTDGPHTITVNITVARQQAFWFDDIQYVPSASNPLDNKAVLLGPTFSTLQYGPAWTDLTSVGVPVKVTSQKGSTFNYEFYGVSLSWFGVIPHEFPGNASTGSFSVDGQSPQTFNLQGHAAAEQNTFYHQKFFETSTYPMGKHKLTVTFNGDSSSTPLTLENLVITNGSSTATSTATPPGNTASQSSGQTLHNEAGKVNIGAIVGGVVGGIVLLLALAFLFFLRRRRNHRNPSPRTRRSLDPEPVVAEPFHSLLLHPTSPSAGTTQSSTSFVGSQQQPYDPYRSTDHPRQASNPFESGSVGSSAVLVSPQAGPEPVPYNPTSSKAREAAAERQAHRHVMNASISQSDFSSTAPSSSRSDPRPPDVIRHQDSGARLNARPAVELPPLYSEG